MGDDDSSESKKTGTYLFVRQKGARRTSGADEAGGPAVEAAPDVGHPAVEAPESAPDLAVQPDPPAEGAQVTNRGALPEALPEPAPLRVRHRRRRLEPEQLDSRLCFFLAPDAPETALYRSVATDLAAMTGTRRLWIAAVSPQAGASLTTANLGSALSAFGRVTLVDAAGPESPRPLRALFGFPERARTWAPRAGDPLDVWLLSDQIGLHTANGLGPSPDETRGVLGALALAADFVLVDGPRLDDLPDRELPAEAFDAILLVARSVDLATGAYERALDLIGTRRVAGVLLNDAPAPNASPEGTRAP